MIVTILVVLCLIAAIICFLAQVYLIVESPWSDSEAEGFLAFMLLFPIVFLLLPTFVAKIGDKNIEYKEPTAIIRTNNTTVIMFLDEKGTVRSWDYKEVSFWTAEKIVIEETKGKNLWGSKVNNDYNVVATNNTVLEK